MYSFRFAKISDAAFLLKVKNDDQVRKWSIVTHDKIVMKDHINWLKKTLRTKTTILFVIIHKKTRIGDVRIDNFYDERNQQPSPPIISIRLLPKYRGRGIGKEVISAFDVYRPIAHIVEGNVRSMNLFISCGYNIRSYSNGVYTFEKR